MLVFLLSTLLLPQAEQNPDHAAARRMAYTRIARAKAVAADRAVVRSVVTKNAQGETQAQIEERDKQWIANPNYALRKKLIQGPCGSRLRKLARSDSHIVEVILMDNQGALVCASAETSDYWQGDEAKWQKPFVEGQAAFLDDPAYDTSSATYGLQLSVPVKRRGRTIGALTLTLKLPESLVRTAKKKTTGS